MEKAKQRIDSIYAKKKKVPKVDDIKLGQYGLQGIILRPYQTDGVNWLIERYHRGHGCILGDEMGLGKTCQTISTLVYLHGSGEGKGPHLILSPLSVLGNWKDEIARFAPKLKFVIYVGSKDARKELREEMQEADDVNAVITTYEICLKDESFLRRFGAWHTLVVDEAHRLKNRESLLHKVLIDFNVQHRVLLTGTPIQNDMKELFALLSFIAPSVFKARYEQEFVDKYGGLKLEQGGPSKSVTSELHDLLHPFLLRRVKSEVVKDLPKKSEVLLYHGMSALQKKYYKALLTKDLEVFENANTTTKTRLMNILMHLRKCVNHPYLFDGVEPEPFVLGEHLVEASGKLVLLDQLLAHLKNQGHKVLLFSQMTRMLDVLQDYLGYRGYNYERLDGSIRGEERFLAIQNFNADEDTFIFMLSTKAGGQGLNLVAADTVIFVDSDFNPQNDLQAAARAHRIGQTRPVKIIRLVGRSTVDEMILKRAQSKLKLTQAVIGSGQFSTLDKSELEDSIELQDILKFGVDKLFENEDSSIEAVDFDTILGTSREGEWQSNPDATTQSQGSLGSAAAAEEDEDEDAKMEGTSGSMYVYDGTDYSKEPTVEDQKVFDNLIAAQKAVLEESLVAGRALRKTKGLTLAGVMPEASLPRKLRKQLSPEELEQRKKQKAETAARRAKEAEQEEIRKAQEQRQRRELFWAASGYTSCNITLASDGEDEEEEEEEEAEQVELDAEDEAGSSRRDIQYLVGDVTIPQQSKGKAVIIVHCVDLALGDVHLIPVDDLEGIGKGIYYCALIVAQHRDRRNNLSGIKLAALSQGLQSLCKVAKQHNASVHLPRIGHSTRGFNWYGTERLIRKHLSTRGTPTFVYYYPRRQQTKKRRQHHVSDSDSDSDSDSGAERAPGPKRRRSSLLGRQTTLTPSQVNKRSVDSSQSTSCTLPLPDFMKGVSLHFHESVKADEIKRLGRHVVAYNGDVETFPSEGTTHRCVAEDWTEGSDEDMKVSKAAKKQQKQVVTVTIKWVQDCIKKQCLLDTKPYLVGTLEHD